MNRNIAERLLGQSTFDCIRFVVAENPQIAALHLREYNYVPNQPPTADETDKPISRGDFLNGDTVDQVINTLTDPGANLSVSSRITLTSGKPAHLAMMDLAPRKSPEALAKVMTRLTDIVVPQFGGGIIFETNKSYHFLGFEPLSEENWLNFLGLNLITSIVTYVGEDQPRTHEVIADYRYIGHSLLRRSTGLRITTRGTKTFSPIAVALI